VKQPPFVIFGLPRSRTAWLSWFLSGDGVDRPCGHDIGAKLDTVEEIVDTLQNKLCGTAETGSMMGWRLIRKAIPECRFLVVERPVYEVEESLERCGLPVARQEIDMRRKWLDEIKQQYGVLHFNSTSLNDVAFSAQVFRVCHGRLPSSEWVRYAVTQNVQIDIPLRVSLLQGRVSKISAIKLAVAERDFELRNARLPFVTIRQERWSDVEKEHAELSREHFQEVEEGVEPRRPYKIDAALLSEMDKLNVIHIHAARIDGELVGYCCWNIMPDAESAGLLIATHGPWFVVGRQDVRSLHLGTLLFDRSIEALKERGVKCVFPHHRMQGRGARLGAFYERRGAKEIQRTYCLWIGD
jgi:GNAT superfamily N-acetyltransferase